MSQPVYDANEGDSSVNVVINKMGSRRIANPVQFLLTPYTVTDAMAAGLRLPPDMPSGSPTAQTSETLYHSTLSQFVHYQMSSYKHTFIFNFTDEGRADFNATQFLVQFEPDEQSDVISTDVGTPIVIFDDLIDDPATELFLVYITLVNSTNDRLNITRESAWVDINDNEGTCKSIVLYPGIYNSD